MTADRFQTLLARIVPRQLEINAAERHIATIRTRLAEAFVLKGFVRAGSYDASDHDLIGTQRMVGHMQLE